MGMTHCSIFERDVMRSAPYGQVDGLVTKCYLNNLFFRLFLFSIHAVTGESKANHLAGNGSSQPYEVPADVGP